MYLNDNSQIHFEINYKAANQSGLAISYLHRRFARLADHPGRINNGKAILFHQNQVDRKYALYRNPSSLLYLPTEKKYFQKQKHQIKKTILRGTEQILLVDDEKGIITMEKAMLERLGYQVTAHSSSIKALETFLANADKFDLIITDMAMPDISGEQLAIQVAKIRKDIPILLCTGFSDTISEEKATSLGIKGFLMKPLIMKDLSDMIRNVLTKNNGT